MINQDSFKRAKATQNDSKTVKPKKLIKRLNAALEAAPPKGQYDAIKELVGNREVAALKKHFELTEYVSAHTMRWDLINSFNDEAE